MSAAIHNHVVADATTSTFDQVKQGVVDAGNWVGRQAQWIYNGIKDIIMKIIEAVKPFFSAAATFVQQQAGKIKDFVMANKEVSLAVLVAVPLAFMGGLAIYFLCCGGKETPAANKP